MNNELGIKLRINRIIALLVIWQFFSILMITVFNWPNELIWLNIFFVSLFILFTKTYESLKLLIISIPFFVVLPNPYFDTLSIWRPLFLLLFFVWILRDKRLRIKDIVYMPWDRILGYFAIFSLAITLFFAKFPFQGIKQLLFFVNIYFIYLILINTLRSKEHILGIMKCAIWSLGIFVFFGFLQFILTFFLDLETFWVFWASNVSPIFYGGAFSKVALYSNSWFSYTGQKELRMFSLMPDSQSFAYLCVFFIALLLPFVILITKKRRFLVWSAIRSSALAILLSGTRAVWVGVLFPFFTLLFLYLKNIQKFFAKRVLFVIIFILFLFLISPLINLGLQNLRYKRQENFVDRAKSIYNLKEASNAGRILIWKESLKEFALKPFGIGLDNFISTLNTSDDYKKASEEINLRYNLPQKYITAHSLYLQILVEVGILGFGIFLWFWVKVIKTIINFLKKYKNSENPLVFFVFSASVIFSWLLVSAVFDVTFFNDKVLMYFFLCLGLIGVIIKRFEEVEN